MFLNLLLLFLLHLGVAELYLVGSSSLLYVVDARYESEEACMEVARVPVRLFCLLIFSIYASQAHRGILFFLPYALYVAILISQTWLPTTMLKVKQPPTPLHAL